jgi:hypothetical protein
MKKKRINRQKLYCSKCGEELDKDTYENKQNIFCLNDGCEHYYAGEIEEAEVERGNSKHHKAYFEEE